MCIDSLGISRGWKGREICRACQQKAEFGIAERQEKSDTKMQGARILSFRRQKCFGES